MPARIRCPRCRGTGVTQHHRGGLVPCDYCGRSLHTIQNVDRHEVDLSTAQRNVDSNYYDPDLDEVVTDTEHLDDPMTDHLEY